MKIRHLVDVGKTNPIQSQSKPISEKAKMNVTKVLTKNYENIANWALFENKPNTNPIKAKQSQFQRQKNAVLHLFAVGYLRKK